MRRDVYKRQALAPGYEAVRRAADTAGAEQRVENTEELEKLLGLSLIHI